MPCSLIAPCNSWSAANSLRSWNLGNCVKTPTGLDCKATLPNRVDLKNPREGRAKHYLGCQAVRVDLRDS